jgi:hypothetical protein
MSAHENDSEMAEAVIDLDKMDTTAKSGLPTLTVTPATEVYHSATSVIVVEDQIPSNSTAKFVEKKGEPKIARSKSPNPNYVDKSTFPVETQPPYLRAKNSCERLARFQAHARHMEDCLQKGTTPRGLTVKKFPLFGQHSKDFNIKWRTILEDTEIKLTSALKDYAVAKCRGEDNFVKLQYSEMLEWIPQTQIDMVARELNTYTKHKAEEFYKGKKEEPKPDPFDPIAKAAAKVAKLSTEAKDEPDELPRKRKRVATGTEEKRRSPSRGQKGSNQRPKRRSRSRSRSRSRNRSHKRRNSRSRRSRSRSRSRGRRFQRPAGNRRRRFQNKRNKKETVSSSNQDRNKAITDICSMLQKLAR